MKKLSNIWRNDPGRFGFAAVLILLSVWFYRSTVDEFPTHIHGWTQSDRYALALGYVDNGLDLFHPTTNSLETIDGITSADLPFNEYLVAIAMKISGSRSPAIFRVFTLLWGLVGVWFFYLLIRKITDNFWKAALGALMLFCAPVFAYYQGGFIPSIPAIACAIAGYYFFFSYLEKYDKKKLLWSLGFLTFAALMRFPFVMVLIAVSLQTGLYIWKRNLPKKHLIWFAASFGAIALMWLWNKHLTNEYGSIFLGELMPFDSWENFTSTIDYIRDTWFWNYFSLPQYVVLLACVLALFWTAYKKRLGASITRLHLLTQFGILATGGLMYFVFMGQQFRNHDYYFLDALFLPTLLLLVAGLQALPKPKGIGKWTFATGAILLGAWMSVKTAGVLEYRNTDRPWDMYNYTLQQFEEAETLLDEHVISNNAKILVLDGYSTNMPLVKLNRKGWVLRRTTSKNILESLKMPCDYVVIMNSSIVNDIWNHEPKAAHHLVYMASNGKITLYKKNYDNDREYMEMAGLTLREVLRYTDFDFDTDPKKGWEAKSIVDVADRTGKVAYFSENDTYGLSYTTSGEGLKKHDMLVLEGFYSVHAKREAFALAVSVTAPDGTVKEYREYPIQESIQPNDGWKNLVYTHELSSEILPEDEIKLYFFNKSQTKVAIDNLRIWMFR